MYIITPMYANLQNFIIDSSDKIQFKNSSTEIIHMIFYIFYQTIMKSDFS